MPQGKGKDPYTKAIMTVNNSTKKSRPARKSEKPVAEQQKCSLSFAIDHEHGGRKISVAGAIASCD